MEHLGEEHIIVWLIAPMPDPGFETDLRPTARLFQSEQDARAVLDDTPPGFHLWRATLKLTYGLYGFDLVE